MSTLNTLSKTRKTTILKANDTFILFNPKFHQFLKIEKSVNVQEQMIKIPEKLLKKQIYSEKKLTTTTRFKVF